MLRCMVSFVAIELFKNWRVWLEIPGCEYQILPSGTLNIYFQFCCWYWHECQILMTPLEQANEHHSMVIKKKWL